LLALESTHAKLMKHALKDGGETKAYQELETTHNALEWELKDEQTATKEKR
jgi:hypothetical protein